MSDKIQPWKAAWTAEAKAAAPVEAGVDYGVAQGNVAVVDGTAANVKPSVRVQQCEKNQPWKATWPGEAAVEQAAAAPAADYGVAQGDIAVVDGTAANVKPKKKTVRTVRITRDE